HGRRCSYGLGAQAQRPVPERQWQGEGGGVCPPRYDSTVRRGLALADYARAKGLPEDFLRALGVSEVALNRARALRIPYLDAGGAAPDALPRGRRESGPSLAVLRVPRAQGPARPRDRQPRRHHRGPRVRLRDGRTVPQLSPRLWPRATGHPPGVAEVPLPLLLLPRPQCGLLHIRLQTWFPFPIQVYVNGHDGLPRQPAK